MVGKMPSVDAFFYDSRVQRHPLIIAHSPHHCLLRALFELHIFIIN